MSKYNEITEYIYNLKRLGSKLDLRNIRRLLKLIGNPQNSFKSILVGGTNGKGSTATMIASILMEEGFKVGLFTKPHLLSYTERFTINGVPISEEDVVRIFYELKPCMERMSLCKRYRHPSFFEATVALAFKYFCEQNVDVAVVEVGLGGRLDATNVLNPLVSVITNIHLEHTKILGDTVEKIAWEKAHIIKPDGLAITATDRKEAYKVISRIARRRRAKLFRVGSDLTFNVKRADLNGEVFDLKSLTTYYENLKVKMLGLHQVVNGAIAVGAVELLRFRGLEVSEESIRRGLEEAFIPGRFEVVQKSPMVILDCAKDPAAASTLKNEYLRLFNPRKAILVVSISSDKDYKNMVKEFCSFSKTVIACRHKVMDRGLNPNVLASEAEKHGRTAMVVDDVKEAVKEALKITSNDDVIVVTGSVFTVGEARELWFNKVSLIGREFNESI
ncbi:bifunctional folylpolyglutamate synthase/dihydrofolate synthase [Candidatus Bathyarchaeota archaeon]|nr:bifunctional folylpolyglutamate synthase/dihydrofolate synthase [Candidatus Bathyarchaeota archaeon]MBS7612720.1 bifunctional folylpolyglutamate synthase/dihydrofolate synthase [Candidatus Bathyarchaeota archaeon]MBS7617764.1 bifunctional folylpolyglutamate synthase/dihydrofolate synthase [Candidatus Bathyarchaeota archaeon]